jgi:transaldolase
MKLFLDTANLEEIRQVRDWGILDGVTTNPSHVFKTGARPSELYPEICRIVDGPVSLEAVGLDAESIVREARSLAKIADNVVVKVPITKDGLVAVKRLSAEGIRTNVTTTFSPLQALLAAKIGAAYISPFIGRLDYVGHRGMEVVEQIRKIYENYGFKTQIIVAAIRSPLHVLDAALIGADICTLYFEYMKMLYQHPMTDISIEHFLKDWEKVPK